MQFARLILWSVVVLSATTFGGPQLCLGAETDVSESGVQKMHVSYEVADWGARFSAEIELKVVVRRTGNVVRISTTSVKTTVIENTPPNGFPTAGIARVEWELTIDDFKRGRGFKRVVRTDQGRTVKPEKDGSYRLEDGENVRQVTVEHKGEKTNNVSKSFGDFSARVGGSAPLGPGIGDDQVSPEADAELKKLRQQLAKHQSKVKELWELYKEALFLSDKNLRDRVANDYGDRAEAHEAVVKAIEKRIRQLEAETASEAK